MDQTPQPPAQGLTQDPGRWIGRVIVAVLVAEGTWGLLSSLTRNLILPFLARQMGGDPQSPLSLGKGDYNFPAIFGSILELCLAGMVAVILNAWLNRGAKQVRVVRVTKTAAAPAPSVSIASAVPPATAQTPVISPPKPAPIPPPVAPAVVPPAVQKSVPAPPPVSAATPPVKPPVAKPEKPKPPKEIYYNIVGEPINPTEDE
jgi:hypothetical protein